MNKGDFPGPRRLTSSDSREPRESCLKTWDPKEATSQGPLHGASWGRLFTWGSLVPAREESCLGLDHTKLVILAEPWGTARAP